MSAKQMLWVLAVVALGMVCWAGSAQAGVLHVNGLYELTGNTSETYDEVYVGTTTAGTLNIKDSASLTSTDGGETIYIGDQKLGTVNLSGGTLTAINGETWVGWWTTGVLNISGGTANLKKVVIYDGQLNITAGTLTSTNSDLQIDWDEISSLLAISGGAANLRGIKMGNAKGTLTLTGGALNLGTGGIYGHASSTINLGGGTLKLSDGGAIALALDSDKVDYLYIDGVQQLAGTWGKTGSGADYINDTYFKGNGVLTVLLPEPATMALLGLGGLGLLLRRKRSK